MINYIYVKSMEERFSIYQTFLSLSTWYIFDIAKILVAVINHCKGENARTFPCMKEVKQVFLVPKKRNIVAMCVYIFHCLH